MARLTEYRGHIRNWRELSTRLGIDAEEFIAAAAGGDSAAGRKALEEEILVKGYEKWGTDLPDHIYGMFALTIEDEENGLIYGLRDQFGTKPYYYYVTADGRLLASLSIRKIMEQDGFVKGFNPDMLQLFLTYTYVPGEDTFFMGLKKLMPGHFLIFKDGELKVERYWAPEFNPDESKSLEDWADEIHTTLQSVIKQVKTDDETAESFLSGGVDSSYVLAMSDAVAADSCGYEDARFDESPLAEKTAELLGRKFNRRIVQPEEYFAIVPWVMENMELPLADASAIVFALGCQATAEHTKLCYSGEGADEFFGGYNMYRNAERYGDNLKTFYIGNTNIMKEDEKQRLLKYYNPDLLPIDIAAPIYDEIEGYDPLTKMSDVDIRLWLEGDIYLNVDKMSTAAGLEIRMPLTDRRIFDIASRLPARFKVNEEQNKVAFRTAASKVLPDEIAFRKKLGFIVPIRHWMADERYNADVREKLSSGTAAKFFNMEELQGIWDEYIGGNSDLWRKIWTVYAFLAWYDIYF